MFLASILGISATLLGIGRVSLYLKVVGASIRVCVSLFKLGTLCCSSKCQFLLDLCWLMSKNFRLILG